MQSGNNESIDYLLLQRITEQLKQEIVTELSDVSTSYVPHLRGVIETRGEYKINFNPSVEKSLTRKWKTWYNQVIGLVGQTDYRTYQELITINSNVDAGWYIRKNDVPTYSKKIQNLLDEIKEILSIRVEYSSYYSDVNNLVINVTAKQVSISISTIVLFYDEVSKLIEKADIPKDQKEEMLTTIKEAKSEPENSGKFRQVLRELHEKFAKYSPELSVICSLLPALM